MSRKHGTVKKRIVSWIITLTMVMGLCNGIMFAENAEAVSVTNAQAIAWVQSKVGQSIDYDGAYGAQCVDLILAYYNYLGVPTSSGNGKDYATNSLPSGWSRVQGGTPQKGDILVYGASGSNPYGHVAIYESDYVTYHQNFNTNPYVQRITYKYNSLANPYWGYIRPNWSSGTTQSISFTEYKLNYTNNTNAEMYIKILNPNREKFSSVGCDLFDTNGVLLKTYSETCSLATNYVNYTCNINTDMGYTLSPGTTYKIQLRAVVNGKTYKDAVRSFTTSGSANPEFTNIKNVNITENSIEFSCDVNSQTVSGFGSYLSKDRSSLFSANNKSSATMDSSTVLLNGITSRWKNLIAGTTYYYSFWLVYKGVEYRSEVKSFKTLGTAPTTKPTPSPTTKPTKTPSAQPTTTARPTTKPTPSPTTKPTKTQSAQPTTTASPTSNTSQSYSYSSGNYTYSTKATLKFKKKKVRIKKGKKKTLKFKVKNIGLLTAETSNKYVVKLVKLQRPKLVIKGKGRGKAVITLKGSGKKTKCRVTVR